MRAACESTRAARYRVTMKCKIEVTRADCTRGRRADHGQTRRVHRFLHSDPNIVRTVQYITGSACPNHVVAVTEPVDALLEVLIRPVDIVVMGESLVWPSNAKTAIKWRRIGSRLRSRGLDESLLPPGCGCGGTTLSERIYLIDPEILSFRFTGHDPEVLPRGRLVGDIPMPCTMPTLEGFFGSPDLRVLLRTKDWVGLRRSQPAIQFYPTLEDGHPRSAPPRFRHLGSKYGLAVTLILSIRDYDPTPTASYLEWLLRLRKKRTLPPFKDRHVVWQLLARFDELKSVPAFTGPRDIHAYDTVDELAGVVGNARRIASKAAIVRRNRRTGEKLFATAGPWTAISITGREAAAGLLHDTPWCVRNPRHFESYGIGPHSPLFLLLHDAVRYFLFHNASGQFRDADNQPVGAAEGQCRRKLPAIAALREVFQEIRRVLDRLGMPIEPHGKETRLPYLLSRTDEELAADNRVHSDAGEASHASSSGEPGTVDVGGGGRIPNAWGAGRPRAGESPSIAASRANSANPQASVVERNLTPASTPTDELLLADWLGQWRRVATDCGRVDRRLVTRWARAAYRDAWFTPPDTFLVAESPVTAAITCTLLRQNARRYRSPRGGRSTNGGPGRRNPTTTGSTAWSAARSRPR